MNPPATLRLDALLDGDRVVSASVVNTRPLAARMLVGRSVEDALKLVPVLFSLCGRAQMLAATAACAAAGHHTALRPDDAEEERLIAIENAQEHLWRLMLDWPALFGHEPRRQRFAILHRRLTRVVEEPQASFKVGGDILDLLATELLAGFFQSMREPRGLGEFADCAARGGPLGATLADLILMGSFRCDADDAIPLLTPHTATDWCERFAGVPDDAFCRSPTCDEVPHETGALARHASSPLVAMLVAEGHRVAARLFARAVDVAECASRLRHPLAEDLPVLIDAALCAAATGVSTVETARGQLLHAVRIEDGRIADYAIIAPTEWNFHPAGAFAREGCGWSAPDREAALLRLRALALSLDPCVEYELVLREADHA